MAHEHDPAMREKVEITVAHCKCGAWKRTNGEWMPGPFGPVERLLASILTATPEVRALVARIVSGGPQAVEAVTESLRARADGLLDVASLMADPHDARAKAARLRALAGS